MSQWKMIYLARRNPALMAEDFPQAWREHSALGRQCVNVADRVNRGRSARMPGRSNPNSRYTSEQVQSVRELTAQGLTGDAIAARTGINRNAVYRIRNGQN